MCWQVWRIGIIAATLGVVLVALVECAGATYLTAQQERVLQIAREVGSSIEVNGERFPLTAQLIVWQESRAGAYGANADGVVVGDINLPFGERSYGNWQVRMVAYHAAAKRYPHIIHYQTDEEVIAALIYNDRYGALVATAYFAYLYERSGYRWKQALLMYNRGPTGATSGHDPNNYVASMMEIRRQVIDPFNAGNYIVIPEGAGP
ncbi:MAG: hypothetical protein ACNA8H_12405 [Anaerolineales bacterium]